jgi:hypothetical protein
VIKATIIAHSVSPSGQEIVTFELEYPRFIHSELMTHRLFSRNAASSRAIPVAKMIEMVRQSPAAPIHWGKNQPGMQAKEELIGLALSAVEGQWYTAATMAAKCAESMAYYDAHKQIVNRILEPFQWMKTVVTATEFDNFFWLRKHADAQPEIKELAERMWEALQASEAQTLLPGMWHLPYADTMLLNDEEGNLCQQVYFCQHEGQTMETSLEDALAISSSCCAQVSYRKLDDSLDKARTIYQRLVESEPVHASPFEHQATPMSYPFVVESDYRDTEEGVTHADVDLNYWSGNFKGWIQHRQLIPKNTCWKYEEQE